MERTCLRVAKITFKMKNKVGGIGLADFKTYSIGNQNCVFDSIIDIRSREERRGPLIRSMSNMRRGLIVLNTWH